MDVDEEEYGNNLTDYDSWDSYHEAVAQIRAGGTGVQDRNAYLPSPDEVAERCWQVRFLKRECEFDDYFVASVMVWGCPAFDRVVQMVDRYGARETRARLANFLTNGRD